MEARWNTAFLITALQTDWRYSTHLLDEMFPGKSKAEIMSYCQND